MARERWMLRNERHFYRGDGDGDCPHCPAFGHLPCLTTTPESAAEPRWQAEVMGPLVVALAIGLKHRESAPSGGSDAS